MCIPFPHPFVAASSSRHPLSSAVGASQFSPGREAWVSCPTQPLPSFRAERPGFFLARVVCAPGRVGRNLSFLHHSLALHLGFAPGLPHCYLSTPSSLQLSAFLMT